MIKLKTYKTQTTPRRAVRVDRLICGVMKVLPKETSTLWIFSSGYRNTPFLQFSIF